MSIINRNLTNVRGPKYSRVIAIGGAVIYIGIIQPLLGIAGLLTYGLADLWHWLTKIIRKRGTGNMRKVLPPRISPPDPPARLGNLGAWIGGSMILVIAIGTGVGIAICL